ncbi:BtpA family membrane complex biogenesis protein [Mesorhizobium loti]|nr:BtpA/SgcQ family protein [Mesorhizobium loti]PLP58242.1 BtpA family membrane complex biogenesis protein [Mesorhizobium loti]
MTTSESKPVLERLFGTSKPIIGMVHVLPLPGSPSYRNGSLGRVYEQAVEEALILEEGGVDGILLENAGDIPFRKPGDIDFETIGSMSVIGDRVRRATKLPLGFNIVANAAKASLACAKSSGAQFVRVNQWANAYVANEGIIEGAASQAMRYRRLLDAEDIVVLADVHVKHGSHAIVGDRDIEDQARDVEFFGAEILIATGTRTGHATAPSEVREIRAGSVGPILVGSGFSSENAAELLSVADGAIVGSYVKGNGKMHGDKVVLSKVKALMDTVRTLRG